jgi:hypothetical protein
MFNKISSVILAILLFAVLVGSAGQDRYAVFMASLGILMVATFVLNFIRIGLSWPHLLLPMLYLLGIGSVFMVITGPTIRLLFLIVAAVTFYLLELNLGHESHLLQNVYLISVFALYIGIFAIHYYFSLNTIYAVLAVFFVTYLLIIQGFAGFSLPAKKYFNLLMALTMAEAAWGLTFWPTHFVVNAVVLFAIFYIIWIFSFSAFFGKLSWKKIFLQLGLVTIVLSATLASAAWKPLVR